MTKQKTLKLTRTLNGCTVRLHFPDTGESDATILEKVKEIIAHAYSREKILHNQTLDIGEFQ